MSLVFPAGYFRQRWKQYLLLKMSETSKWTKSTQKNLGILVDELLFIIKSVHPLVCFVRVCEFSEVLTESSHAKPVPTLLQHLHYTVSSTSPARSAPHVCSLIAAGEEFQPKIFCALQVKVKRNSTWFNSKETPIEQVSSYLHIHVS